MIALLRYASVLAYLALLGAILSGRAHAQDVNGQRGGDSPEDRRITGASAVDEDRGTLTFEQRELALARVTFNEADDSEGDLEMIAQGVLAKGTTARARLAWIKRHSPCASGVLSQDVAYTRPGRCRWTRNLTPVGHRPRGWLDSDGPWVHRARWRAHLRRAVAYVRGDEIADFCPVPLDTWDSWSSRDQRLASGHFEEIKCRHQTRNVPYRFVRGGGVS